MIQILPAILDKTPEAYKVHMDMLENSRNFQESWVHIDFADNDFVPNQTVGVEVISEYPTSLHKEAHLMVSHPLEWIDKLKSAGFERVIFHFEAKDDISGCIQKIKNAGMEVGIALNITTPIDVLEPFKDTIDLVLIMCIVAGFQGQPFLPEALEKVKDLKEKNWPLRISVDGSIRDETAKSVVKAGADQLSVGSFLLKGDIDENLEKLWEVLR